MFCSKCRHANDENAKFCAKCGLSLTGDQIDTNNVSSNGNGNNYRIVTDNPSHFAGFISCCFPIVGLILYFIWKDDKPNSSKLICKWMIAGLVAYVLIYIVFFLIGLVGASSMSDPYYFY